MLAAMVSHPPAVRAPHAQVAHVTVADAQAAHGQVAHAQVAHVTVARRCYRVGQKVAVTGTGFAATAPFNIAVDGVDFGQSVTSATGGFSTGLLPGGLGAGQFQLSDTLVASDGSLTASTHFTVTRGTGALFGNGSGGSPQRRVPFDVWDFAPTGPQVTVYLHYVSPAGTATASVRLGTTAGQCGALVSAPRALFPFSPTAGTWTLQFDTSRSYRAKAAGRVARLKVSIS